MRKCIALLLMMILCATIQAQELQNYGATVVDASTGEVLPYVSIYASEGNGTLTNQVGRFSLRVSGDTPLRISCVGYNKVEMRADALPRVLKLKPLVRDLREVTVSPVKEKQLIEAIIKRLDEDFRQFGKQEDNYFYRTLLTDSVHTHLIEAFMQGRSAVNMRGLKLISGIKGVDSDGGDSDLIHDTNMHNLLPAAPRSYDDAKWADCVKPFTSYRMTKKYYQFTINTMTQEDGTLLYRIDFQLRKKNSKSEKPRMHGTAYVDAVDYRLLRFDGDVEKLYMRVQLNRTPMPLHLHIDYDYSQGYAQIGTLSIEGSGKFDKKDLITPLFKQLHFRTLMFRLSQPLPIEIEANRIGADLIGSIQRAGYDPALWDQFNIIERTAEEEKIAFGQTSDVQRPLQAKTPQAPRVTPIVQASNEQLQQIKRQSLSNQVHFPQEKIFLHMDNTSYCLGDTLWFAAYSKRTDTSSASNISGLLYVELLNQDGYLVERKLIQMQGGQGSGYFALNHDNMYGGFYELRAYTRWQLNWGRQQRPHSRVAASWFFNAELEENYYRDYEKLYSRVFPVYDKPLDAEQRERQMTPRMMQRPSLAQRSDKRKLLLTLYPEGGNLVQGMESRIAYEAAWDDGEYAQGYLLCGGDTVPVQNRGRGLFTYTPSADSHSQVTFVAADGTRVHTDLPKAMPQGPTLSVTRDSTHWNLHVCLPHPTDSIGLSIHNEGRLAFFRQPREREQTYRIPEQQIQTGVQQVTLFNAKGQVLADRLFFALNPSEVAPTVSVEGLQAEYQPMQPVDLTLQIADAQGKKVLQPMLSLAIHDGSQQMPTTDRSTILSEMLLSSEIRGFVPDAQWFFEQDDEEHRQALDLLMLTQGWRRFDWREMVEGIQVVEPHEDTQVLSGMVLRTGDLDPRSREIRRGLNFYHPEWVVGEPYDPSSRTSKDMLSKKKKNKFSKREYTVHALAVSNQDEYPFTAIETDNAHFHLRTPRFWGDCLMHMGATEYKFNGNRERKELVHKWDELHDPEYESFRELIKHEVYPVEHQVLINYPYPRFCQPYSFYQQQSNIATSEQQGVLDTADVHVLREVEVEEGQAGMRQFTDGNPALVLDDMDIENQVIDAGMYYADDLIARTLLGEVAPGEKALVLHRYGLSPHMRQILQKPIPPLDEFYQRGNLLSVPGSYGFSKNELRDYIGIGTLEKRAIYTDFAPRLQGDKRYLSSDRPEVHIADYPHRQQGQRPEYTERFFRLQGYDIPVEFYHPDYSKHRLPEDQKDYRRTLYWNPSVKFDEEGKARVQFYNNSHTTHLTLDAEGMSSRGTLLWGRE